MLRKALASILYSPLRLALTVVVAGCLLIGSFLVLDDGSQQHQAFGAATEHQDAPAQPVAGVRSPASGDSESSTPRDGKAQRRVLRRFLGGYLIGARQGAYPSGELQRVTTPALWRGLKVADRSAVPDGSVVHLRRAMGGAYAVEYLVSLDSGDRFVVDMVLTPSGWRVCDVEPQRGP